MRPNTKRVALVSTWQELCGIAHYSYFLKRGLDHHVDVTVLPTKRDLIQKAKTRKEERAADAYIDEIASFLGAFDSVIVQFEPGIYGNTTAKALARVRRLLQRSKNFSIAFHFLPREDRRTIPQIVRSRSIRLAISELKAAMRGYAWSGFFKALMKHSKRYKVTAITHNKSDARYLSFQLPGIEILDNPLTYMDETYIAALPAMASKSEMARLLPEPKSDTRYLGVFGFYSPYKGFETVIEALNYLPADYELLMFSSVHHTSLSPNQGINDYLRQLKQMVDKENLLDRVHFIGSVSDEDMLLGMMACDAVIAPYTNSGHAASGVASQAIELDRPTYLTRNDLFNEFGKYFSGNFEFFDIGNSIELAQKIRRNKTHRIHTEVNGLRLVHFPRKSRSVTIDDAIANYLRAIGLDAPVAVPKFNYDQQARAKDTMKALGVEVASAVPTPHKQ